MPRAVDYIVAVALYPEVGVNKGIAKRLLCNKQSRTLRAWVSVQLSLHVFEQNSVARSLYLRARISVKKPVVQLSHIRESDMTGDMTFDDEMRFKHGFLALLRR